MNTGNYLDETKRSLGIDSDYALSPYLEVTRSQISRWRNGKDTFSDKMALKISKITNIPLPKILADSHKEKCTDEEIKKGWAEISEIFSNAKTGFCDLMRTALFACKSIGYVQSA